MTMTFDAFLRRWGKLASIVHTPDGRTELAVLTQPRFDEMATDFSSISGFERRARGVNKPLTTRLVVNKATANFWDYDEADILNAKLEFGDGRHMEKFCWDPVTGEWLFVQPGQNHATAVPRGKAKFDDYIRGIVLRSSRTVTFRPFWPTWRQSGPYDSFDEEDGVVSFEAQYECEQMLRKHSKDSWTFQYNISNKALTEMTGIARW